MLRRHLGTNEARLVWMALRDEGRVESFTHQSKLLGDLKQNSPSVRKTVFVHRECKDHIGLIHSFI